MNQICMDIGDADNIYKSCLEVRGVRLEIGVNMSNMILQQEKIGGLVVT